MDYKMIINKKGLKQKWLAQQIGVSDGMISQVIKGKKELSDYNKKKLHRILGLK